MKCFITTFNHRSWPEAMLVDVRRLGMEPVLFDNGSNWPPMVEWLSSVDCEVIRLNGNHGCYGFFNLGVHKDQRQPFVQTDGDLDLSGVPSDAIERLRKALDLNPDVGKAGLSLEWLDLPDRYSLKGKAIAFESQHWSERRPGDCFRAGVGATFALYDPSRFDILDRDFYAAVRLDRPYTARHRPWYIDLDRLDDETAYFLDHCIGPAYYSTAARDLIKAKQCT